MKPGVTGLAQMQLPADTAMSDVRAKLAYDLHYVENISLALDIRIAMSTGMYFLSEVAQDLGPSCSCDLNRRSFRPSS